jgi:serine kinase of HPr protein (carbohydrate metabolism regulator)
MTPASPPFPSETVHASCVAIDGRGVLIAGASGSGKSDLALRLIDRGAILVSDDYTLVIPVAGRLVANAPPTIAGRMEVRGIGLVETEAADGVPLCLCVDLDRPPERLPEGDARVKVAGLDLPAIGLAALEASAPIKVEFALLQFGLMRA